MILRSFSTLIILWFYDIETKSFSELWGLFMALDIFVYDSEVICEHKIFFFGIW